MGLESFDSCSILFKFFFRMNYLLIFFCYCGLVSVRVLSIRWAMMQLFSDGISFNLSDLIQFHLFNSTLFVL